MVRYAALRVVTVIMAAYFSQYAQLASESAAVPAHHEMKTDGHALTQRQPAIHRLGYFLRYVAAFEHPVLHHFSYPS